MQILTLQIWNEDLEFDLEGNEGFEFDKTLKFMELTLSPADSGPTISGLSSLQREAESTLPRTATQSLAG